MYLELTDEQAFLVEAAAGTLARVDTLASSRAALDGGEFVSLWDVAVEAGWPGLLCSEGVDGAGLGAYEAMLVLEACGARLADARLLGHLPACAVLEAVGGFDELRRELAAGSKRAALVALPELQGVAEHVLDAAVADVLVVAGSSGAGLAAVSDLGITIEPQPAYDATRSLARVTIDAAALTPLGIESGRGGVALQRALLAAESVGAAEACLQMAREYAIERHAFGRAIGSYQAIKHKLVEMMRRVEAARSLLVGAGRAWASDRAEFALLANAARVAAAGALDYAAPENIFVHGGIGATWEHDAQLYYRRAELSRRLAGGAETAADHVAEELFARISG
jgi:alkylation response protein AidB-like acyl-CoA dehydrogenase